MKSFTTILFAAILISILLLLVDATRNVSRAYNVPSIRKHRPKHNTKTIIEALRNHNKVVASTTGTVLPSAVVSRLGVDHNEQPGVEGDADDDNAMSGNDPDISPSQQGLVGFSGAYFVGPSPSNIQYLAGGDLLTGNVKVYRKPPVFRPPFSCSCSV